MRPHLLLMALALASMATTAHAVSYAVLPMQPWVQATQGNADWIADKMYRELKAAKVTVISGPKVIAAMQAAGAKDTLSCNNDCLLKIGKALDVDFVIAPTLSLQKKEQSVGVVWLWRMRQMNVRESKPWGEFARMCMCPEHMWDGIARVMIERLRTFDPANDLKLPPGSPVAKPTKGPHDEPGMVFVPAGPFIMGADLGEGDESPRHIVDVSAFYIGTYEITNAEYNTCVAAGKCARLRYAHDSTLNKPNQPAVALGWDDAVAYCRFAGKRLPTEAEWEKAARGTDERIYPWGNDWHIEWVNQHAAVDGFEATAPVGSFKNNVSPYGAYDMAGNAWEWMHDFHGFTYYRHSPAKDPQGPENGIKHTMRGGSWMYDVPFFVTSHNRSPGRPWIRKRYVGGRCAKSL